MKIVIASVTLLLILVSCSKKNDTQKPATTTVDVSCQQYVDALGNFLTSSGTCPSVTDTSFTAQETALFNSLDTADLTGTIKPDSAAFIAFYPNPFQAPAGFRTMCRFAHMNSGYVVAKFILTDSLLNPVFKTAKRISFSKPRSSFNLLLQPAINAGRFRLFYSLSAQSHNNYLRGWINVTATN